MSSPTVGTAGDPHLQLTALVPEQRGPFGEEQRILADDAPQAEYDAKFYDKDADPPRTPFALHWGQRKLLMSEIEFLTKYGDLASKVVYAGAAKGYHVPYLASMFPMHEFDLYDPAEFAIQPTNRISIYNVKMTDDVARQYTKQAVLFISDIRTAENPVYPKGINKQERLAIDRTYAARIANDNAMQLGWTKIMKPKMSMVKFKLPYYDVDGKDFTMYPQGDVFLPVWGKPTTTETRLMYKDPSKLIKYTHKKYENQMFYFNSVTLLSYYPHHQGPESSYHPIGIDHCYSCRSELYILGQYVKSKYNIEDEELQRALIKNLSESVSPGLSPQHYDLVAKYEVNRARALNPQTKKPQTKYYNK